GGAGALGDLVDLAGEALAVAGDEEDVVVGLRREEVLDEIVVVGIRTDDTLAAALLGAELGDAGALDEAGVGDGDDHALVGDDVLHAEVAHVGHDLGFAGGGVFAAGGEEFLLDDVEQAAFGVEDGAQLLDGAQELGVLLLD